MEDVKRKKEMEMLEERQFWAEIEHEERERKAVIESERRRMLVSFSISTNYVDCIKKLDCFTIYEKLFSCIKRAYFLKLSP